MSNEYFYFIDAALLEHCVRDELNKSAPRRLAVIDPLEINIVNFKNLNLPSKVPVANHPSDESFGKRDVAMSNKLFIGSFAHIKLTFLITVCRKSRFRRKCSKRFPTTYPCPACRSEVWRNRCHCKEGS